MSATVKPLTWKSKKLWNNIKETLEGQKFLVVFDLETTGLSPEKDRIIELAALLFRYDEKTLCMSMLDDLHMFINPEIPIDKAITDLTGISNESVADKPTESEAFETISEFFNETIVSGYNVESFDVNFLKNMYARQGCEYKTKGIIDILRMARDRIDKTEIENHKLVTVGDYFGIKFRAHSALGDTATTASLLQLFLFEYMNAESDESSAEPLNGTERPDVQSVTFWEGYQGYSRIYVNTSAGSLFYDIRGHCWEPKDAELNIIDMEWLESECWRIAEVKSEPEFIKFKGTIKVA